MTENQEKELFNTLATLVNGINGIQSDVRDMKSTLGEHSRKLDEHSATLGVLVGKVDSIAEVVMANDRRLSHVEKVVDDLRSGVH